MPDRIGGVVAKRSTGGTKKNHCRNVEMTLAGGDATKDDSRLAGDHRKYRVEEGEQEDDHVEPL